MKKVILLAALIFVIGQTKAQTGILKMKPDTLVWPNPKKVFNDTLVVKMEYYKYINIGGRIYEIKPPTLEEVKPNNTWLLPSYKFITPSTQGTAVGL